MRVRFALFLAIAACGGSQPGATTATTATTATPSPGAAPPAPELPVTEMSLADVGLDELALDKTADPCDDFYQFACGTWIARTEIPADKPSYTRSFNGIGDTNLEYLRDALEKAAKDAATSDPVLGKLGAFYGSCMDEAAIEKAGTAPIKPLLALATKVKDGKTLTAAVSELHKDNVGVFWNFGSINDFKDATQVIAGFFQGGLGLPERDYYTRTDVASQKLLTFYQDHMATMLGFAGMSPAAAKKAAKDVVAFETELAKASKTNTELRDPVKLYNRVDRDGLSEEAPHIDWDAYFAAMGIADIKSVTVSSLEFFPAVDKLITTTPMPTIRAYLAYHIVEDTADLLGKKVLAAHFQLDQALSGQERDQPRWKRCVRATDGALGMLLAQQYVKDKFAGDSKDKANETMKAIAAAMEANLDALDWMDDVTRKQAQDKLHAMTYQIGYPDNWREYDFAVDRKSYGKNALAGRWFENRRDLRKIGKPVDKKDWGMTPPTVNAYYTPLFNAMVFPAGILQPPFFDRKNAAAVNFGAIGMVMGHELTHGFDDQGSQFDSDGNLQNWWSESVGAKFKARTKCVADQYSQYDAVPGTKVNGALTTGENIADIGGLKLAFLAYRKARAGAKERIRAGGFTEDQLFYLGYAQAWCTNAHPEFLRLLAQTNPHSPAQWRVNGVVTDESDFAAAFQCKVGAKMHPANACAVW